MALSFVDVSYTYNAGKPDAHPALSNIDLNFEEGSFTVIAGPCGSGKTTLVSLMNGLVKPTGGKVLFNGRAVGIDTVGVLYQQPETQLFARTVLEDAMFGPLNLGRGRAQAESDALWALAAAGLDQSLYGRSPFSLSDGQKRLAALAGVFAMKVRVLVLDEPDAGLDYPSCTKVFGTLKALQEDGITVIVVSHNAENAALYADNYVIMENGRIARCGRTGQVMALAPARYRTQAMLLAGELGLENGALDCVMTDSALVRAILHRAGTH